MRRSREEARETRRRIVETASRLFRARGIARVSVADVVSALGLTEGAFYRHFEGKDALVAEAIEAASLETIARQDATAPDARPSARRALLVGAYLSKPHCDHPEAGCPVAALAAEIPRESPSARRAFSRALERVLRVMADVDPGDSQEARRRRLRTAASLVGAVVLARATTDEALAREILAAVRQAPELRAARARG
jgi:TetR/AcrR family transcriptional repressor of nem operon